MPFLGPRLRRVVLLELLPATPHLFDGARTSVTWMTACVNSPDELTRAGYTKGWH
jgi:hypothetical protein